MDEVEPRRRRTRTRSGDPASEAPATAMPGPPAHADVPDVPYAAVAVSPADIADRAAFERPAAERGTAEIHHPFDSHVHSAHDDRDGERGLRGLVGGGSTQVSVAAAMRARDAARPTPEDLAAAEANLAIVHRGWIPRDPG